MNSHIMCITFYCVLQKAVNTMYVQEKNSRVVVLWQAWIFKSLVPCGSVKEVINSEKGG